MQYMNDTTELIKKTTALLTERKAEKTSAVNISKLNSYFDWFVITTGSSSLHCRSLARAVEDLMALEGRKLRFHPDMDSEWIVLDYDDIVFHIFSSEARNYYQLERLWGDGTFLEQ